jgi:hypothetical protein
LGSSWAKIALRCARMNLKWVCVRSGMFLSAPAVVLQAFAAYGISVYTWHYCYPSKWMAEVATVTACRAAGSQGHVLDPEIEYLDHGAEAKAFTGALRAAVPDFFIGFAPFSDPGYFPNYPYAEFSAGTDACMPQFYWTPAHKTAQGWITWADPMWAKIKQTYSMPILSVWGGNDPRGIDPKGGPFSVADLQWALMYYVNKPACSLWALESMHASCEAFLQSIAPMVVPVVPSYDLTTVAGYQDALAHLGYYKGKIDGLNGPQTKAAVIGFQMDHGLPPTTGVCGPMTQTAILKALA